MGTGVNQLTNRIKPFCDNCYYVSQVVLLSFSALLRMGGDYGHNWIGVLPTV